MHANKDTNNRNPLTEGIKEPDENHRQIADFRDFVKDYAKIVSRLNEGSVYYIYSLLNGLEYKIFNVSVFDSAIDNGKIYIPVSGRHMQDATLFFLQFSRDTMVNLRIFSTKNRSYLVEPRIEALSWSAKRLGLASRKELGRAITGGSLRDIFISDVREIKNKHRNQKKHLDAENSNPAQFAEVEQLESELANLRLKELVILQKLGREKSLHLKHKDERIRWQDERIAQLRRFISDNGLEIPSPMTTQFSRYASRTKK